VLFARSTRYFHVPASVVRAWPACTYIMSGVPTKAAVGAAVFVMRTVTVFAPAWHRGFRHR
jgi:hypothetical protein